MKKNLINSLVISLLFSSVVSVTMPVVTAYASPSETTTTETKPIEATDGKNNTEKLAVIEDNIEKIDNQIEKSMLKVSDLKKDIDKAEEDIKTIDLNIKNTEDDLSKQKDLMDGRLRAIYKKDYSNNPIFTYLDIMLSGKSFSEIVTQITNVNKMNEMDNNLMKSIKEKEDSLKKDKEDSLAKKEKLDSDKKEIEENLKNQENLKNEQKKLLDQTIKDIAKENQEKAEELKRINDQKEKLLSEQTPIVNAKNEKYNDKINQVIKESYNYLGVPYVWGGETPNGFDCSGYMQYIFNKVGVNLPRVSEAQQTVGIPVANNDLQPGDLIFWGYPAHHVGMYIGDGKYIQAPHTGDVIKISTLGAYTNAKRVL